MNCEKCKWKYHEDQAPFCCFAMEKPTECPATLKERLVDVICVRDVALAELNELKPELAEARQCVRILMTSQYHTLSNATINRCQKVLEGGK